ncbi:unnamed protein product [Merluccius merluccius]
MLDKGHSALAIENHKYMKAVVESLRYTACQGITQRVLTLFSVSLIVLLPVLVPVSWSSSRSAVLLYPGALHLHKSLGSHSGPASSAPNCPGVTSWLSATSPSFP